MKRIALCLFSGAGGGALGLKEAGFHTIGIDYNEEAAADYRMLTGHPCHVLDLKTASSADLLACTDGMYPEVILTSPPCQGFSGNLGHELSKTEHYQQLCELAQRGLFITLEAFKLCPPRLVLLENVPNIKSKGRAFLDENNAMFEQYGYAWAETTHDCATLGGLAQHRRRFLAVARHVASTPEYLFEPEDQPVKTIGSVIGQLPIPSIKKDKLNPMHTISKISALNWLRLACIPEGGDWRDLPERVHLIDETVIDPRIGKPRREGSLGVSRWDGQCHAIIARAIIQNTSLSVADPRLGHSPRRGSYGVMGWEQTARTVTAAATHDNSSSSLSDDRIDGFTHKLIKHEGELYLIGPIMDYTSRKGADMRIEALDGRWHRPMTTLELAMLQSFPVQDEQGNWLKLAGNAHERWRIRIGNAIPPRAAKAIGEQMMTTLNMSDQGMLYLSSQTIWVDDDIDSPEPVDVVCRVH